MKGKDKMNKQQKLKISLISILLFISIFSLPIIAEEYINKDYIILERGLYGTDEKEYVKSVLSYHSINSNDDFTTQTGLILKASSKESIEWSEKFLSNIDPEKNNKLTLDMIIALYISGKNRQIMAWDEYEQRGIKLDRDLDYFHSAMTKYTRLHQFMFSSINAYFDTLLIKGLPLVEVEQRYKNIVQKGFSDKLSSNEIETLKKIITEDIDFVVQEKKESYYGFGIAIQIYFYQTGDVRFLKTVWNSESLLCKRTVNQIIQNSDYEPLVNEMADWYDDYFKTKYNKKTDEETMLSDYVFFLKRHKSKEKISKIIRNHIKNPPEYLRSRHRTMISILGGGGWSENQIRDNQQFLSEYTQNMEQTIKQCRELKFYTD